MASLDDARERSRSPTARPLFQKDLNRDGVFFDTASFPVTGTMANKNMTSDQLRESIASWRNEWSPGPLTQEQHRQFHEEGWVVVHDIVPKEVLQGAVEAVQGLVDDVAQRLLKAGKIEDPCSSSDFYSRLIELEKQFPNAGVLLHKHGVLPPGIQDVWSHRNLMAVAEQLLGRSTDIMGHPVWNLRCKTPENTSLGQATVPWHQDNAYLDEECWDKLMVTAWVPLVDATVKNGCMQVVRRGHLPGVTANHACCVGGTWYTEVTPEELEATLGCNMKKDVVTCEVPFGSVLLLNNLIPHRSLPNYSEGVRWSLDLRWQRGGEPNGFSGIKGSVLMKPARQQWDGKVDWGDWASKSRTEIQIAAVSTESMNLVQEVGKSEGRYDESPEFDTTIAGPWMTRWNLIHHNRHTANMTSK